MGEVWFFPTPLAPLALLSAMDIYDQAEALNQVSATYVRAEVDNVPLQQMSTNELSKLAAARGIPPSHARAELITAIARDTAAQAARSGAGEDRVRGGGGTGGGGAAPPMRMNQMNEFDGGEGGDAEDVDAYLVGAVSVVWEDELYTFGGLAPEGEFVTAVSRWSGRGQTSEVAARASDPRVGVPPGRYGHSAVVVGDQLFVFGGQGQFGCLNDLWVFDFEACTWSLIDVVGAPPSVRTSHCACVSDDVMFIFGGKDVAPGQDAVTHTDLYGFDLKESEWLTIETRWRRPAGGDGCAMAASTGILYVLSPAETCMEMVVWCLQLSTAGALRWTQVPRSGQLPTPRTNFASCVFGSNWVIHGGRVLLQDGVLGDTFVFNFPTAEWGRLPPESDTDPRFGHTGSTVDGALVLLHGKRAADVTARPGAAPDPAHDTGVCIAINLETYMMFPDHEGTSDGGDRNSSQGHAKAAKDVQEEDPAPVETTESVGRVKARKLDALNKQGVTGQRGGLIGGSMHAGHKGSHHAGDVALVAGNVKLHAHREIIEAASPGLARLMALRPVAGALARRPDLVTYALGVHPVAGQVLGLLLHLLHVLLVVVSFSVRAAVQAGTGGRRTTLVFRDMRVPVLVAMLRWIYRIPLHPAGSTAQDLGLRV